MASDNGGVDTIEMASMPAANNTTTIKVSPPIVVESTGDSQERNTNTSIRTITTGNTTAHIDIKEKLLSNTIINSNGGDGITVTTNTENKIDESQLVPALPSTSNQIFYEAAAIHGGDETRNFLQQESASSAQLQQFNKQHRLQSASSTLDASISRNPSTTGGKHEKKIGHRRVDDVGEVTYKKIQSKQIMGSIQLGIQHTVGSLASKPKRDLLMNDFWEMETISFPPDGSSITPAHHYNDFRFKVYAPIAFRYFRDLFGIQPDDFLMSICAAPLRQLSNPGASGSIFYLTDDDEFIIKTVQKKECEFLQKLLPGYYMNLSQNPRTLLPKFFGLYCFNYNTKNVRLVAMNNLLPSDIKMHAKYDLKGSTFRRKASKTERQKASPTFKDLDFMEHHPNGIFLEVDKYNALMNRIKRDCMVLESFQIMDYSFLMGIHNVDIAQKEKREERIRNARAKLQRSEEIRESDDAPEVDQLQISTYYTAPSSSASVIQGAAGSALNRTRSINRQRLVAHSTAMESITADMDTPIEEDEDVPAGGIPARSENDERLILYIGIIDILQSYRFEKKLEHTFKSIIYNGDTVSVCRPSFYAQRFQNFMGKTVFKKTPTFPLKHSPSKRKTSTITVRTPQRTPSQSIVSNVRPTLMTGSSTPPPAFDDISEEDLTGARRQSNPNRNIFIQRSRVSSNRSVLSDATDDYSDDDIASGYSGVPRSPVITTAPMSITKIQVRSPKLTKTSVQLTSIGCPDDENNDDINEKSLEQAKNTDHKHNSTLKNVNDIEVDNPAAIGIVSSMKATAIKDVQPQTYTSTLVVNDVR